MSLLSVGITGQLSLLTFIIVGGGLDNNVCTPIRNALRDQGRSAPPLLRFGQELETHDFICHTIQSTPFYNQLQQQLLDPAFLEAFFLFFPWHALERGSAGVRVIGSKYIDLLDGKKSFSLLRLLSLRHLPGNNPSWGDDAKAALSEMMKRVIYEVCALYYVVCTSSHNPGTGGLEF